MATRPTQLSEQATQMRFHVATGQTVEPGRPILLSGSDDECAHAGAGSDLAVGISQNGGTAGDPIDAFMFGPVVPVKVGTGGATRGKKAIIVSDGVTDAPDHDSDGTGNQAIYGIFVQSGVAGDFVGMMPVPSNRGS